MSGQDVIAIAPGVTREEFGCWGYQFVGTKDALIRSALAQESWFVALGERDRLGRMARSKKFEIDGRRVETRVPATGPAYVTFRYTDAELAAMKPQLAAEEARKRTRKIEVLLQYENYCPELKKRLESRYAGVRIISVDVRAFDGGEIQQVVRYQAPLAQLVASGLVTERMCKTHNSNMTTELGCLFGLYESIDDASVEGSRDLIIRSREFSCDGRRLTQKGLREVAKLLGKFQPKRV
jgi:hypothetical protein